MRLHKSKAQVSLEMAIALIGVMVILFASINVFVWLNKRLVMRQRDYENTRVAAGNAPMQSTANEIQVDESGYSKLYMFEGFKKK